MISPLVSVIVPAFNVEHYIEACLDSLAHQTHRELEVIVIDDGSTDATPEIAAAYAARDERFQLVQQANAGPGAARNVGLARAKGPYLSFVDGDDLLPSYAYDLLTGTLEQTGSDFAAGAVRRLSSRGTRPTETYSRIFNRRRLKTDAKRYRALLYDRIPCNKVFRRSFWERHGLGFPEGIRHEDIPVVIKAIALAESIDVLSEPIYFWRQREHGELSFTQVRTNIRALEDRFVAMREAREFLLGYDEQLAQAYLRIMVNDEIPMYLRVLHKSSPEYRQRCRELVTEQLAGVPLKVARAVSDRIKYHLLLSGRLDDLLEVLAFEDEVKDQVPVRRIGKRFFAQYPKPAMRGTPRRLLTLNHEFTLASEVETVTWREGLLVFEGHAYISLLDIPRHSDTSMHAFIVERGSDRRTELPITLSRRPDVTADKSNLRFNYDWSGFTIALDPSLLSHDGRFDDSSWKIELTVRTHDVERSGVLNKVKPGPAQAPPVREVAPGTDLVVDISGGTLTLRMAPTVARAQSAHFEGDFLILQGVAEGRWTDGAVVAKRRRHSSMRPCTARFDETDGRTSFTVTVDLGSLLEYDVVDRTAYAERIGDGIEWGFWLTRGGELVRIRFGPTCREIITSHSGHELAVQRTRISNLSLEIRAFRAIVSSARWTDEGTLEFSGMFRDPDPGPFELIARTRKEPREFAVPLEREGERFTARLRPWAHPVPGHQLCLPSGNYQLSTKPASGDELSLSTIKVDHSTIELGINPRSEQERTVQLRVQDYDKLNLVVSEDEREEERGAYSQVRLRKRYASRSNRGRLRDLVLYDSFFGSQFSDSPRAIFEELLRRDLTLEHVWVSRDGRVRAPDGARIVRHNSIEYHEALVQARTIVNNHIMPAWWAKRGGQRYLQTWHGTPLKRVGYDLDPSKYASPNALPRFSNDVRKWDYFVSPNPFSTQIFRRAFRYDGEVIESGYPRNDILNHPARDQVARATRRVLEITPDQPVVLYAPTWRDDRYLEPGQYRFDLMLDLELLQKALGDDAIFLLRAHNFVRGSIMTQRNKNVLDVTAYPDIRDLYLAADILITDYSSVMFDFAVTGKPILFFTYDLEHYRDELRGFYFDFEDSAPGPLLVTVEALAEALADLPAVKNAYAPRYQAFVERFCPLDDGKAAARVVDRLFG